MVKAAAWSSLRFRARWRPASALALAKPAFEVEQPLDGPADRIADTDEVPADRADRLIDLRGRQCHGRGTIARRREPRIHRAGYIARDRADYLPGSLSTSHAACWTARQGVGPLPKPSDDVITSRLNEATQAPVPLPYFLSETR